MSVLQETLAMFEAAAQGRSNCADSLVAEELFLILLAHFAGLGNPWTRNSPDSGAKAQKCDVRE